MHRSASLFGGLLFVLTSNGNFSIADAFACHCPLLSQIECSNCFANCIWETSLTACQATSSTGYGYSKWNGFIELGQTHVVKATGETRHAPDVISEREAELLFTPTELPPPTFPPTAAPTGTIVHEWGLEQMGELEVELENDDDEWVAGYPSDESKLLVIGSEYDVHNNNTNININFDLLTNRLIQGVYLKSWYVTRIGSIEVAVHPDDGHEGEQPQTGSLTIPDPLEGGWKLFSTSPITKGYNNERIIFIPKIPARYVQIRLHGGWSAYNDRWGLRHIQISGNLDGLVGVTNTTNEEDDALNGVKYFPLDDANVRVAAYSDTGSLLGVINMRNPSNQRPLLEQSLTNTTLLPYSALAWSATLPWHWVKEGTKLLVGTTDPTTEELLLHQLTLHGLGHWGVHTLTRTKVAIFGTPSDFTQLDTFTHEPSKLARGMFNSMPTSELHWVDSEVWHLPYLVINTSSGPRLVSSEAERRQVLIDAGDDPDDEPRWEILKNHLAFRHRLADTGRGLAQVDLSCCGGNPYASGTSIFMGWALSKNNTNTWGWDKLGYWDGWGAAAWTGWCGMRPGDECGNTLIHELGHSQTLAHFTSGSSVNWGIEDEYPSDGVNLETHPWGYDTTSRRFRTWYKHNDISVGKHDPMNGGEKANSETCFPQYTGYHAAKSQQWAKSSPVLLSKGMGKNVDSDGAYFYSSESRQYEKVTQQNITSIVGEGSFLPLEAGVPVVTLIGTIGDNDEVCQIYPAARSSSGNTFHLPDPYDSSLPSMFNGAMHSVEVRFDDGSVKRGLVAVPSMKGLTELKFFSLTVAISHRPVAIDLYQYESHMYPNLSKSSTKKLLFSRSIDLPPNDPLEGLVPVLRVGRGHLGDPTDITIDHRCIDDEECFSMSKTLEWRGKEAMTYHATDINPSNSNSKGTLFDLTVVREEDGTEHMVTVVVSRFVGENGPSGPLSESRSDLMSPDSTHGIRVWASYDLNSGLLPGVYRTSSSQDALEIEATLSDNSVFTTFRIFIKFDVLEPTEIVDLSDGATFTSAQQFFPTLGPDAPSSAFFLATDPSIGPTTYVWWGESYETLYIPMISSCTGRKVIANVKAQQTKTCGTSKWQFNAGRSADQCGYMLVLTLDGPNVNPWLDKFPQGCTFSTHPGSPIVIDAYGWHQGVRLLGSLVLQVTAMLPVRTSISTDSAEYTIGTPISITFKNGNPSTSAWVGIYPAGHDPNNISAEPNLWLYTCGKISCVNATSSGVLVFGESRADESEQAEWMLGIGEYSVFLFENLKAPYQAVAVTSFTITMPILSPISYPTSTPTLKPLQ